MAEGKIRVKFEAKDSDKLISAIKSLNVETKKLTGSSAKYENQTKKTDKANVNLRNNTNTLGKTFFGFGSILTQARAKLLLYAFAVQQASQLVNKLVRTSANIKDMSRAFDNLSQSVGFSSDTFDKLNNAVDGTMRKTELMQQANNALLLGIFENSDQMANMFDVAQRLGQALGRTASESIESLVTGLGRQSKLMLDNLGIVFDTNQAYIEYAKSLDKNVNTLTEQEKKQAFVNKAISIANDLVAQSGEEVLGTNAKLDQLNVSFENFQATVGELVTPVVTAVSSSLVVLFNTISDGVNKFIDFTNASSQLITTGENLTQKINKAKNEFMSLGLSSDELKTILSNLNAESNLIGTSINVMGKEIEITATSLLGLKKAINESADPLSNFNFRVNSEETIIAKVEETDKIKELNDEQLRDYKKQQALILQTRMRTVSGLAGALSQVAGQHKQGAKAAKRFSQIQAVIDTYAAANTALKSFPPPFGAIAMAGVIAQGLANVAQIESQKFEQGGLVGGRRHSQGGTMIEAERGEFVMSRNAVSAIGVENLNRMNQGQSSGGGSINININGGMISPDFVENELAESIREAVRRGADFGIS